MEHKGTRELDTGRLILRRFKADDAEAMYRNWASDPEVTKFLMWPTHESVDVSRGVLEEWVGRYDDPEYYVWAIVPKELGEPIGSIAAVEMDNTARSVHIGYCIGRNWWKQGFTSEALKTVIAFFFDEIGMNSVTSRHDPRNPNSGRVMLKAGMTREGTLRASDHNNQGIADKVWYLITKEEYEQAKEFEGRISRIDDPDEKRAISRRVLEALPDWFGVEESREKYISESASQIFFAAYDEAGREPIGFICLKETGKQTAEIAVMGVLQKYHKQGIGRQLFRAARRAASGIGYRFLQVKTVKMGVYEDYDRTNRFYQSLGFSELEVFPLLWDEYNPCQIYIMTC